MYEYRVRSGVTSFLFFCLSFEVRMAHNNQASFLSFSFLSFALLPL
jgi:hypothetical protein